jgi:hypothetical protein
LAISSTSTLAEVIAQFEDNADYDVSADTAKAKLFIVACRILLRRNPNEVAHGTGRVRIEPGAIQGELDAAMAWLKANDSTSVAGPRGYVRYANFRNFRT